MHKLKSLLFILSILTCVACTHLTQPVNLQRDETVVLLHGLFRSDRSMASLANYLEGHGYQVINVDYQSTRYPVETLVKQVNQQLVSHGISAAKKVHFVTHSLGGIITRHLLKEYSIPQLGRVVMLSPPNKGSELIDTFRGLNLLKKIAGPAAVSLGTEVESLPNRLGPVDFELGIVTGNWSNNPIYSAIIPGEDDGKVSIKSAKVEGMKDFSVLPYSHTFIMNKRKVQEEVLHFLVHGSFSTS